MAFDFRLPDVGEGLHEGTLVEWLVAVGEDVALDQPFARIETDKAVVDLPAPRAARVTQLHFSPGDLIEVGQVMISFSGDAPATRDGPAADAAAAPTGNGTSDSAAPARPPSVAALEDSDPRSFLATPHTRALARKLGVALAQVRPSGRGGRITDEDVERAAQQPVAATRPTTATPAAPSAVTAPPRAVPQVIGEEREERQPLSHLRRVIANAMAHSKRTAAHVTHVDEADVTDLLAIQKRACQHIETKGGPKLTLLPYFIKAAASALIDHPLLNASYDEDAQEIVYKHHRHIGVAVDTADGLVVPVIRHADQKDLLTIASELADIAERARRRQLTLDELKGATFTLSSLGPLGGAFATPIIHHPELAIVGLHAIKDRPAVVDGQVLPRKTMFISCSYDHRIIDGAVAARFMHDFLEMVQKPDLLMLRL
ncbi:MAG: 2-oxo acid dehydrogenase subunit E2 [Deltaproteobacteria bacterium]|nr:2-oxo acid dehydrogenase subunit E2 [Deltaproteobacteria bacterium]